MVFGASAGGYALPGGRPKNRAAPPPPDPETSSQLPNIASPPTVADQTGRSPPTTLKPPTAVLLHGLFYQWSVEVLKSVLTENQRVMRTLS
jgi:hypothetical protein